MAAAARAVAVVVAAAAAVVVAGAVAAAANQPGAAVSFINLQWLFGCLGENDTPSTSTSGLARRGRRLNLLICICLLIVLRD